MDIEEILPKIKKYCVFQERSCLEVRKKLFTYKLDINQIDDIIFKLQKDNFINEQRFVSEFVKGKLNTKKWGKIKIIEQLKLKGISKELIDKQLNEIDNDFYYKKLNENIDKWLKINILNNSTKNKLYRYLLSKGFENEIIRERFSQLKIEIE